MTPPRAARKVFVVGGGDDRGPRPASVPAHAQRDATQDVPTRALPHVQIFDVATAEWTAGPALSARREGFPGRRQPRAVPPSAHDPVRFP
jgi:hypothetical protein